MGVSGATFAMGLYIGSMNNNSSVPQQTAVKAIVSKVPLTAKTDVDSTLESLDAVPAGVQYSDTGEVLLSPDALWAQRNKQLGVQDAPVVSTDDQTGTQVYQTWEEAFSTPDVAAEDLVEQEAAMLMEQELQQDLALNGELPDESMIQDSGEPMLDVDLGMGALASVESSLMDDQFGFILGDRYDY